MQTTSNLLQTATPEANMTFSDGDVGILRYVTYRKHISCTREQYSPNLSNSQPVRVSNINRI